LNVGLVVDDPESLLSGTPIEIADIPNSELACQIRALISHSGVASLIATADISRTSAV
jgi:hypothetical protein